MNNKRFSPILLKYLRSFLLVQIIPLIFLAYMLYNNQITDLENNIKNQYKDALSDMSIKIDYIVSDILESSSDMEHRYNVSLFLNTTIDIDSNSIISTISHYQSELSFCPEIFFYNKERKEVFTVDGSLSYQQFENSRLNSFDASMIQLYSKLNATKNYQIFSSSYIADMLPSKKLYIVCCSPLSKNTTASGNIIYSFTPKQIDTLFTQSFNNLTTGGLFFFDSSLKDIYLSYIGDDIVPLDSLFLELIKKQQGVGTFEFTYNNNTYFLVKDSSPYTDITYCYFAPKNEIFNQVRQAWTEFFFMVILICLFALVLALISSFHNYSPIQKLLSKTDSSKDFENELDKLEYIIDQQALLKIQLTKQIPLVYNRCLELILLSEKSNSELQDYTKYAGISFKFLYFNVILLHLKKECLDIDTALELIKLMSNSHYDLYPIELETEKNSIAILVNTQCNTTHNDSLIDLCNSLQEYFLQTSQTFTTIGIGNVCKDLEECSKTFLCAKTALNFLQSTESIKHYSDIKTTQMQGNFPTIEYTLLSQSIRYGNQNAASLACDEMLKNIKENSSSLLIMQYLFSELIGKLLRLSVKLNVSYDTVFINRSYLELGNFDDYKLYITQMIKIMCQSVTEQKENTNNPIKKNIMIYISEHYFQNDMSLSSIANSFNVSATLISNIVNEETGMKFNQYITFLRIEKAKEYLASSNLMIKNIVELVGYIDTANFIRKFKTLEGLTPGQYREQAKLKITK